MSIPSLKSSVGSKGLRLPVPVGNGGGEVSRRWEGGDRGEGSGRWGGGRPSSYSEAFGSSWISRLRSRRLPPQPSQSSSTEPTAARLPPGVNATNYSEAAAPLSGWMDSGDGGGVVRYRSGVNPSTHEPRKRHAVSYINTEHRVSRFVSVSGELHRHRNQGKDRQREVPRDANFAEESRRRECASSSVRGFGPFQLRGEMGLPSGSQQLDPRPFPQKPQLLQRRDLDMSFVCKDEGAGAVHRGPQKGGLFPLFGRMARLGDGMAGVEKLQVAEQRMTKSEVGSCHFDQKMSGSGQRRVLQDPGEVHVSPFFRTDSLQVFAHRGDQKRTGSSTGIAGERNHHLGFKQASSRFLGSRVATAFQSKDHYSKAMELIDEPSSSRMHGGRTTATQGAHHCEGNHVATEKGSVREASLISQRILSRHVRKHAPCPSGPAFWNMGGLDSTFSSLPGSKKRFPVADVFMPSKYRNLGSEN